jgi:hypothetical protein
MSRNSREALDSMCNNLPPTRARWVSNLRPITLGKHWTQCVTISPQHVPGEYRTWDLSLFVGIRLLLDQNAHALVSVTIPRVRIHEKGLTHVTKLTGSAKTNVQHYYFMVLPWYLILPPLYWRLLFNQWPLYRLGIWRNILWACISYL